MTRHPVLFTGLGLLFASFAAAVIFATVQGHHPLRPLAELAGLLSRAAALGVSWAG